MWLFKERSVFSKEDLQMIEGAVKWAEGRFSGEIRVVIRKKCKNGLTWREQAMADFIEYVSGKTRGHAGVLISIIVQERKAEVLAGPEINAVVPNQDYFQVVTQIVANGFVRKTPVYGVIAAVEMVGKLLKEKLPRKPGDTNELPDAPVIPK